MVWLLVQIRDVLSKHIALFLGADMVYSTAPCSYDPTHLTTAESYKDGFVS